MTKKLKIHPNERIDADDFMWGTSGYTDGKTAQSNSLLLTGGTPQVLGDFRIEIADQDVAPGQITVHNGALYDSVGNLVTNEEALLSSQGVPLIGANTTFYLELQLAESETDEDDRAIFDQTFYNGPGKLAGKEFMDEVTTRISTTWTIVQPISNTGFELTSNPSSLKVPFAILRTDSSGRITSAVNPGFVTEQFGTVLRTDAPASSSISVLDASLLLEASGSIDIGGEVRVINTINHATGTLTLTTPLSNPMPAGTLVKNVSGPEYMRQRSSPTTEYDYATSTHPDKLSRLFQSNEARGTAVISSNSTAGARTDIQIKTLKDQLDVLAQQIKELKTGSSDAVPPTYATDRRYYEYGGSVQASRTASYTVGNGTTSLGDFNGEDQNPFQAAIDAAQAAGRAHVTIYVKPGFYTFTSPLNINISTTLIAENGPDYGQVYLFCSASMYMFYQFDNLTLDGLAINKTHTSNGIVNCDSTWPLYVYNCFIQHACPFAVSVTGIVPVLMRDSRVLASASATFSGVGFSGIIDNLRMSGSGLSHLISVTGSSSVQVINTTCVHAGADATLINVAAGGNCNNGRIANTKLTFTGTNSAGSLLRVGTGIPAFIEISSTEVAYLSATNQAAAIDLHANSSVKIANLNVYLQPGPGFSGIGVAGVKLRGDTIQFSMTGSTIQLGGAASDGVSAGVIQTAGNISGMTIVGNMLVGLGYGIRLLGTTYTGVNLSSNSVTNSSATPIYSAATTEQTNTVISNNSITSSKFAGILVSGGTITSSTATLSGNTITQDDTVSGMSTIAISVANMLRATITGNSVHGTNAATVDASTTRSSLSAFNIQSLVVNGNTLIWNATGLVGQMPSDMRSIYLYNVVSFAITGNFVQSYPGSSPTFYALVVDKNTGDSNGIFSANMLYGDDVATSFNVQELNGSVVYYSAASNALNYAYA